MNFQSLLLLLAFYSSSVSVSHSIEYPYLKFYYPDRAEGFEAGMFHHHSKVSSGSNSFSIQWSAGDTRQATFNLFERNASDTIRMMMFCHVKNPKRKKDSLQKIEICVQNVYDSTEKCYRAYYEFYRYFINLNGLRLRLKVILKTKSGNIQGGFFRFTGSFKNGSGMKLGFMDFYCKAKNRYSTITSRSLRFNDYYDEVPKKIEMIENPKGPILINKTINYFPCGSHTFSRKVRGTLSKQYDWQICNSSFDSCEDVLLRKEKQLYIKDWNQILNNGTLFIPKFTPEIVKKFKCKYLLCRFHISSMKPKRIYEVRYARPFVFQAGHISNEKVKPRTIHPGPDGEDVILTSSMTKKTLYCNYIIGSRVGSYRWYKEVNGSKIDIDRFPYVKKELNSIHFIELNSSMSGKYICELDADQYGNATNTMTTWYNVWVNSDPIATNDVVPILLIEITQEGSFYCRFKQTYVTRRLGINGYNLNLTSEASLQRSVTEVNRKFKDTMSPLEVKVYPLYISERVESQYLKYTVRLRDSSKQRMLTHQANCIGTNELGSINANVLVKFIPSIAVGLVAFPNISDPRLQSYECQIAKMNNFEEQNPEVKLIIIWRIGSISMTQGDKSDLFEVSQTGTVLKIRKYLSNENFLSFYGSLSCVVNMTYSSHLHPPVNQPRYFYSKHSRKFMSQYTSGAMANGAQLFLIKSLISLFIVGLFITKMVI